VDIRADILRRLSELGWTRYRLASLRKPGISAAQIYRYLRGDTDLSGFRLGILLDVLDLEIQTKAVSRRRDRKRGPESAKKR
jgi:hypothetical protein